MKYLSLAAALLLSACANTPEEIRALGVMHTVVSPAGYEATAKCSIRRYDEIGYGVTHNLRIYDDYAEIVGTGPKPVAYTDFRPAEAGSVANIYASNDLLFRYQIARGMAEAVQGCADTLAVDPLDR